MDKISIQLHTKQIGCCLGNMGVNNLIYVDVLLPFEPSAKGLQTRLDMS